MKNIHILFAGILVATALALGTSRFASAAPVTGSISGTVFVDANCDGFDLSDKPLVGAKAELSSKLLKKKLAMKSDSTGNFLFPSLRLGQYSLRVNPNGKFKPAYDVRLVTISEASGAVSETFVFCPKK